MSQIVREFAEELKKQEAYDYKLRFILANGSRALIWLLSEDRISVSKAFIVAANYAKVNQISVLRNEREEFGHVIGMVNAKDLYMLPDTYISVEDIDNKLRGVKS
jgi:CRISPR/Cas system-associated exonuclease Cas4 (RecB family)